jgi:hypothetical protein
MEKEEKEKKEKKEKWVILCGTGADKNYLTDSEIFEATEKEIFEISPNGVEGGLVDEFCGMKASFPIKITYRSKELLENLVAELKNI